MIVESCDLGFLKKGLCWVWASGDSYRASPFGKWRAPTEKEWVDKPTWKELENHCHSKDFGGHQCDIAHAKKAGSVCFCRAKGACGSLPPQCDLMYVQDLEIHKEKKKHGGMFQFSVDIL